MGLRGVLMRFRLVSAAALLAAVPGMSQALGLGDETVRSFLNAPLNAEIELFATAEELSSLQATLASRDDFIRHGLEYPGFLNSIQLGTERLRDGRNVLRLTSSQPMVEPFVVVLVDVRSGSSRLLKEYTLLLDPPTFQASPVPSAPVTAPVAGDAPATTVRPAPAPVQAPPRPAAPAVQPAAPASPAGGGGQYTVQRGDTLTNIVDREYAGQDRTRAMVAVFRANPEAFSGNINQLRAGAQLSLPDSSAVAAIDRTEASAEVRSQMSSWLATVQPAGESADARLRLVPPSEPAGTGQPGSQGTGPGTATTPAPAPDRPVAVESAELSNLQRGQTAATPATPADPAPPADSTADTPAESPDAEDATAGEAVPAPAEPAPAEVAPPPPAPPADAAPGLLDTLKAYWKFAAGGLVLLLALLALMARRRRSSAAASYAPTPSFDDFVLPGERDSSSDTFPLRRPTDGRDSSIVVEEGTGQHERPAVRKETRTVDLDDGAAGATMGTMALEQGDPLAEADFHMAYGLYDQAADLVKAALKREPDRRDLKLKLLEVFFVWGNKEQFLQTARELSQTRSSAPPGEWEKVVIMGKQLAPEDVLFHQSQMGAQTSVDLNLEGGQNLVDFNLPEGGPDDIGNSVDLNLGATDTGLKSLDSEGGLDFMFDDLRGEDQAPTATTRQMAQPGLDAINAPTIEQPALDIENTLAGKIDAHMPYSGTPDQTAELALDDLGLDLGKLEATGTGMLPPVEDAPADAPTLVAGLDETSRELLASADASQRTEMLPLTDLDLGGTSPGLDMDLGGGDTSLAPMLGGGGNDLDLDVGAADKPEGDWQNTQRIDPGLLDSTILDESPKELEPVTMSEVGTKLDLARAYMDMGDPDGARSILNEVLQEGSDSQRQEAQRLLDSIPG
jgi:pilus assembly protein FimV